ncbi:MAG: thiolase family protein [Bacteriovoracaceae bacterium]|nr:thiolase family protein [Bacteriovoracaceae bacterium]
MMNQEVYIVGGKRTAFSGLMGGLASAPAPILAASTIKALLTDLEISSDLIEAAYFGQVVQAGVGQSPARQAALHGGLKESTIVSTVNKVCGSGLEAINQIYHSLQLNQFQVAIAGGMESMSNAPHLLASSRKGIKFGAGKLIDSVEHDGLTDVYGQSSMGACAEQCNLELKISRKEQDDFAALSYQRAIAANQAGIFKNQITAVTLLNGQKLDCVEDENLAKVNFEKMSQLKPAFSKEAHASITAANASSLNDGAVSLLLTNDPNRFAKNKTRFKIRALSPHSQNPTWFVTAPIQAMKNVLHQAKLNLSDIDVFEINEAFALVVLGCVKELGINLDKVNLHGGAISLGHPIGASGARIVLSLMHVMIEKKARLGMASICIGGGEALSIILEQV